MFQSTSVAATALFVFLVSNNSLNGDDKCNPSLTASPLVPPKTATTTMSKGQGVCCVEVAKVEWNALQPWQRSPQHKSTGTAFIIKGERLLTNAHVVKSAIDIRVRLHGSTRRFPAKVVCYAPEVDLALLEILGQAEHRDFFAQTFRSDDSNGVERTVDGGKQQPTTASSSCMALQFATELPHLQEAVHVVGFPTGGRTICVTEGVVSRIDLVDKIVAIQIDAAINPGNSGGPAFNDQGFVTGVAFRKKITSKSQKVDNIGYLIPAVLVKAFLGRFDARDGTYELAASIPYRFHSMENHSLRLAHQLPDSIHGVLITSVCETAADDGKGLQEGDILTKIDDSPVADDGQVILRGNELIQHVYLLRIKEKDETVTFTVFRNGQHIVCPPYRLCDIPLITPRWEDVDYMPNYMILGSLVLLPMFFAMKHFKGCGSLLKADLIDQASKWPREWKDDKDGLVVLTEIFAHELSFSYNRPWRRVVSYNGIPIRSLAHLQELWSTSCKQNDDRPQMGDTVTPSFVRLQLENDDDLVFEVNSAITAQQEVMGTHAISKPYNIAPPNKKYKHVMGLPPISISMLCLLAALLACIVPCASASPQILIENEQKLVNDVTSFRSRAMASIAAETTRPNNPIHKRSKFPENDPHVCLAFLSCCERLDLLNHTIAGAIRHMEEDEPSFLRYEIAWVDNGSSKESTDAIRDSFQMERALALPSNMGLAYGMNLLTRNLCKAPYVLLLEEDWLYLDDLVAPQTEERKRAIATSIALLENVRRNNITAYDGRNILGTFLRQETYESFLTFPQADIWERIPDVNIRLELPSSGTCNSDNGDSSDIVYIDYRTFCADTGLKSDAIWGSYTNGAGLYHRRDLIKTGRMYGEPGDAFHDRYVEGNFAFRVALRNCHAAIRLTKDESCTAIHDLRCAGAFHHIGGGRGTRPRTADKTICEDPVWNFFGTPLYRKYQKLRAALLGNTLDTFCSAEELEQLRDRQFRDTDTAAYRELVLEENKEVFRREAEERQNLRDEARAVLKLLHSNPEMLRKSVSWMEGLSDAEIEDRAHRMERLANSPHPLEGFWDPLGRVIA
ncbi:trypsin-like peptidase domain containing protein [Nitzschia inconspicua]|uniref:Trypsin-like peptidase domain containing protein n=1 Tax=Nitzschia inconspicua TaxID=303405 RepID=A0A9K3KPT3_9STRA|nr:trypsin-like peptidase domain containing protein [Nitzschia inconspicua]KAG7367875.1 trypsin-like peptidase domain containing protein [Nitzschia inconspicua]